MLNCSPSMAPSSDEGGLGLRHRASHNRRSTTVTKTCLGAQLPHFAIPCLLDEGCIRLLREDVVLGSCQAPLSLCSHAFEGVEAPAATHAVSTLNPKP